MPRFLVTPEMYPGMPRLGIGFFRPGDVITLPDACSRPGDGVPLALLPLDKDAHELLLETARRVIEVTERRLAKMSPPQKMSEAEKEAILARVKSVPEDPDAAAAKPTTRDEGVTMRQFAEGKASPMPAKGRAADR